MKKLKAAIFISVEIVLYCLLLWGNTAVTREICFASIALCLFYTVINFNKKADGILVCGGLFFSLLADSYLVLASPADYYMGVSLFMVVQMFFLVRLIAVFEENNVMRMLHIFLTFLFVLTMTRSVWTVFGEQTNKLKLLATGYFAVFVINVIFAFVHLSKNPLFAVGMLLFLLCDFIIGLQYIDTELPFAVDSFLYKLTHTSINLPWVFYLPGQVMIALNLRKKKAVGSQ